MQETDYTKANNPDTFKSGDFQPYRLLHWMKDILRNFFSSSINLKDERLCGLLNLQDGILPTELNAMFRVGVPFNPKSIIKAGTTPAVIVSAADTSYPVPTLGAPAGLNRTCLQGTARYHGAKHMLMHMQVIVAAETYDGALLLSDLIEAFLATHELELMADCKAISQFNVTGSQGPQEISVDQAGNAKSIYQSTISISLVGGLSWLSYEQGPLFRGMIVDIDVNRKETCTCKH